MEKIWSYLIENLWGIIGVLVSGIGLFLAYLQLKKIADKTSAIDETYKKTIEDLKNSETLTNISTTLQKIENIKNKFQDNKIDALKNDLALVAKLLVTLQSSLSEKIKDINFEKEKELCNELEVRIITEKENDLDKANFRDEYILFSKLELVLTDVQGQIKYKSKN